MDRDKSLMQPLILEKRSFQVTYGLGRWPLTVAEVEATSFGKTCQDVVETDGMGPKTAADGGWL